MVVYLNKSILLSVRFEGWANERIEVRHGLYLQYGDRDGDRSLSILKDYRSRTRDKVLLRISKSAL